VGSPDGVGHGAKVKSPQSAVASGQSKPVASPQSTVLI
jgi:hypothetical protein